MGQGGLYVLVLLCLLGVASVRSQQDVTRCWTKGKEVTISPHECPAGFDGADAKFCCRLCYGANCCMPRKARVNLDKCPREARLAGATPERGTAPDGEATAAPPAYMDLSYLAVLLLLLILSVIFILLSYCSVHWKRCWERSAKFCCSEESTEASIDAPSSRAPPNGALRSNMYSDLLSRSYAVRVDAPPPYSLLYPQGPPDLPPPYPGEPVVAFRRSDPRVQDGTVVIVPLSAAPPEAAESGSSPGKAATGSAPEVADVLEVAASGGALEAADPLGAAASGGASEMAHPREAAASGGALEAADPLEAAASGGALELPE